MIWNVTKLKMLMSMSPIQFSTLKINLKLMLIKNLVKLILVITQLKILSLIPFLRQEKTLVKHLKFLISLMNLVKQTQKVILNSNLLKLNLRLKPSRLKIRLLQLINLPQIQRKMMTMILILNFLARSSRLQLTRFLW